MTEILMTRKSPVPGHLVDRCVVLYCECQNATLDALRAGYALGRELFLAEASYGDGLIGEVAKRIDRHPATLYRWRKVGMLTEGEFEEALRRGLSSQSQLLSLTGEKERFQKLPEKPEESAEALRKAVESATQVLQERLERLQVFQENRAGVLSADEQEQIGGVVELASQDLQWAVEVNVTKDQGPWRSESFKRWACEQGCLVCGDFAEPHHTVLEGMAEKGTDAGIVPLCHAHHLAAQGNVEFWRENLGALWEWFRILHSYIEKTWRES